VESDPPDGLRAHLTHDGFRLELVEQTGAGRWDLRDVFLVSGCRGTWR
jgi:hypothetical protein